MTRPPRVYDTAEWRRIRLDVLKRDGYRCTVQLTPVTRKNPHGCKRAKAVDHIIPVSEGGAPFDMANLRAICTACNTRLRNARRAALARRQLGEPDTPAGKQPPRRRPTKVTTIRW